MQAQLLLLVQENRVLFWSIGDSHLRMLNTQAVVETILNYGDLDSVKNILSPQQEALLPLLEKFSHAYYMVGGTAIALQIGHRRSIDKESRDVWTLKME